MVSSTEIQGESYKLSEKDITKFLQGLGFSKREVQIYMFLAKSGVQSTSFVAKRLKMERVQAYRTFKKLQEKGFIEATLERPTRFTVVPFERLLETFIETRKSEVTSLNEQKTHSNRMANGQRPESGIQLQNSPSLQERKNTRENAKHDRKKPKKILVLTSGSGLVKRTWLEFSMPSNTHLVNAPSN
jgi:sugar-specific transcriptional regulator TrmB